MRAAAYKHYLVIVLLTVYASNATDRLTLGLVLQNIKVDLALTDTQLGLLSGIAFALFYAVMGIPIARWADRGNRVTIIALTTAIWSILVPLSGAAANFLQLLLIRVGVAVGEAGCIPPAHSLIADYFPRAERPRAFSIYMLGGPLSVIIGCFAAGWLNEFYGWRATFVILGLPGLLLALLVRLTMKEPRTERAAAPVPQAQQSATALPEVWRALWSNRTFRYLLLGFSVACFFSNGIGKWQPTFFVRSYGFQTGELGTWFAVIYGLGGVIGLTLGGQWAHRFARNDEPRQLRAMSVMYAVFGVLSALVYVAPGPYAAFGLVALAFIGGTTTSGPLFAIIQTLVPERLRATSIAIVFLFGNLIGLGLGPLLAGALSDALRAVAGDESLRYALLAMSPGYVWVTWNLWRASFTVKDDINAPWRGDAPEHCVEARTANPQRPVAQEYH